MSDTAASAPQALMPNGQPLVITPEERAALYFIPQAPGGMIVSEEMQQQLQDKGLATAVREDGKRWLTEIGDRVRLGKL